MQIVGFAPRGFEGDIVEIEVDLRRGIPGTDIVGLPGGAVRESRERVRAAIRNSGLHYPRDRVLVNLAPAGVRKSGAAFDLAIALAVLSAGGEFTVPDGRTFGRVMVLGELQLDGTVRAVSGVLSAVSWGIAEDVELFIVHTANLAEARALAGERARGVATLTNAVHHLLLERTGHRDSVPIPQGVPGEIVATQERTVRTVFGNSEDWIAVGAPAERPAGDAGWRSGSAGAGDFSDLRGQPRLRRALEVAAAGGHSVLIFGPPGSGKTMAACRIPSILPDLCRTESVEVTRIHSLAGVLPENSGLLRGRPFRMPHHSASLEGMIGGGRVPRPGEASLAHGGVLFLDEAHEFHSNVIQSLREPLETGRISLARADGTLWYPSKFQLVLAANPCPCGNMGKRNATCLCGEQELYRYWRRIGGALIDRIDIRVPVVPSAPERLLEGNGEASDAIRARVVSALRRQKIRFGEDPIVRNSAIPGDRIFELCPSEPSSRNLFVQAVRDLGLSSRAVSSALRVARTIADLDGTELLLEDHLLEAIQMRRYSGSDCDWSSVA